MFKKLALLSTMILLFFSMGCQYLSSKQTTNYTISTLPTMITNSNSTTTENDENPISYDLLFNNEVMHRFVISFSKANFDKLVDDMINYHDQFGTYRDNTIQEVDILYEDSYGNQVVLNEVGFRTKGNIYTRVLPVILDNKGQVVGYQQVSFQLEFNETFSYPDNSTQYKDLKQRRMFDLEQLNFKAIKAEDTGVVTEMVAYDLFREAKVPAPNTSLAVIYFDIDGQVIPYGLYTVTEPLDDVFVRRVFGKNFDGSIGDLYKCVWQQNGPATLEVNDTAAQVGVSDYNLGYRIAYQLKTNKLTSDFSSFTHFVTDLNTYSQTLSYQNKLASILDVDTWLKTLAMSYLIGNPDDYRGNANNYYLYFYEGKAVYIPFDFDQSLGYGWNPYNNYGLTLDIHNYPSVNPSYLTKDKLVLVRNVLAFPEYQDIYEKYILEYTDPTNGIFQYSRYYDEYILARNLYLNELTSVNHLGVREFSLTNRSMNPSKYFSDKIYYARANAEFYQDKR